MKISTTNKTMLYCPKCQKTYADGTQRFCLNEGERLIPSAAGKNASQTSSVFTNVLKRKTGEMPSDFSPSSKLSPTGAKLSTQPDFHLLTNSSIFKAETENDIELELELPNIESRSTFTEPLELLLIPETELLETFSGETLSNPNSDQTETVEKSDFDADAEAENSAAPEVANQVESFVEPISDSESLIGQTIENRYRVVEQISGDESGASYLATDETASGQQVVVNVLTITEDSFAGRVFAEERNALLELNHPNIVRTMAAGELPDGKPYLVNERITGETIKDSLENNGQFDALRAARIVRQIADALDEAHRSGILHRNLTAANVILSVDENGAERVRLIKFGAANEKLNTENLSYKSPEQIEGKIAGFASDNYSLGVIAYQMLINRLPFDASSVGDLLKSQREGIRRQPSDVRFDLPPAINEILKKALSFSWSERYLKMRDFGDAFFSEIIANLPLELESDTEDAIDLIEPAADEIQLITPTDYSEDKTDYSEDKTELTDEIETAKAGHIGLPTATTDEIAPVITPVTASVITPAAVVPTRDAPEAVKATEDLAWEKRSPDASSKSTPLRILISLLGLAALVLGMVALVYYFLNRPDEKPAPPPPVVSEPISQIAPPIGNLALTETNVSSTPVPVEIEAPPSPRQITQPPNTTYFQNSKSSLKGDAVKNYLGFSLYYPSDWVVNNVGNNFLDISKKAPNGLPVEQLLISYYSSKGTFKSDEAEVFLAQVAETNRTLKKILPNYRMISEGKKTVNNGWQAYEVKFEGASKTAAGETIKIWGKRLFIPTASSGMKNGYVVTMLATSLLKDVESVEDVGVKGELSKILETFEPNQNF